MFGCGLSFGYGVIKSFHSGIVFSFGYGVFIWYGII